MQKKSGMSAVSGDVPSRPSWAHSPEREESDEEVVVLSKKDEVAKEAAELLAQQKRLSVRSRVNPIFHPEKELGRVEVPPDPQAPVEHAQGQVDPYK
ncbi:hypothetical protein R1sor_025460 [Riccia sorocarpa]|uniref:Stomatal closure-related actin-binding protein actin-binding domain-containing protein n=1 Tax=Riccia sorocarpa TaxID=122646 RepID=A0ABD3G8P5_9MARC